MALSRRNTRRPGRRFRRKFRRTLTRRVRPMRSRVPTYFFTRYCYSGAPQSSLTTNANGQFFGTISAQGFGGIASSITTLTLPNSSEFSNLYDQYKVLSYTLELIPRFNGRDVAYGPGTVADIPMIYWVYDVDDSTAPTSANEIMERAKVYSARLDKPVRITVKSPTIAASMYASSITTGYYKMRCPWMDVVSAQVPLYGVKFMIQGPATRDYTSLFDLRGKMRLAFRNPR